MNQQLQQILDEVALLLAQIAEKEIRPFTTEILAAGRVFLSGAGRSGLMLRAFAMRLMHLGFTACVVGDVTTPAIASQDLLIIGSGSGETTSLISQAGKAQQVGGRVALLTTAPDSTLGRLADRTLIIPAGKTKLATAAGVVSQQPLGSLFEQGLLLTLDAIILALIEQRKLEMTALSQRHANLE